MPIPQFGRKNCRFFSNFPKKQELLINAHYRILKNDQYYSEVANTDLPQ